MEEYTFLSPEEKIEKYMSKRNTKVATEKWFYIILAIVISTIFSIGIYQKYQSNSIELAIIMVLINLLLIYFLITIRQKSRQKEYILYKKLTTGIAPKIDNHPFNTSYNSIRIVNAKFQRIDLVKGYIFGGEKEIAIDPDIQRAYNIFFEETPQKGETYFLICLESFENPIAVFKGYYSGKKYPTWDCH